MKKPYLAKNIREGVKIAEAKAIIDNLTNGPFKIEVHSMDHGRDTNGNGTAYYRCLLVDSNHRYILTIVESGSKREQVGYSGQNESALYALDKLGYQVDTSKAGSYDYQGVAYYPLIHYIN